MTAILMSTETHEIVECGSEECWQHGSLNMPTADEAAWARGIGYLDEVADYARRWAEARELERLARMGK